MTDGLKVPRRGVTATSAEGTDFPDFPGAMARPGSPLGRRGLATGGSSVSHLAVRRLAPWA